jgi:hypothetical protein
MDRDLGFEDRPRQIESAPVSEFAIVGLGSWGLCVLERTVGGCTRPRNRTI